MPKKKLIDKIRDFFFSLTHSPRQIFCDKFDVEFRTYNSSKPPIDPLEHTKDVSYAYKEDRFTDDDKLKVKQYMWSYVRTHLQEKSFTHICFKFYMGMLLIPMLLIGIAGWFCELYNYSKLASFTIDMAIVFVFAILYIMIPRWCLYHEVSLPIDVKLYYGTKEITEYRQPAPHISDKQKDIFAIYIAFLILFSFQVSALLSH